MSTMLNSAEFIVDKVEYSPKGFLESFSKHLPRLVKVTKGYYGEEQIKTFEIGQVLFIRKVSSQERVVASVLRGPSVLANKLLSIPLDYNANFSYISKKGNKKYSLRRLLSKEDLPIDVIFTPEMATGDVNSSAPASLLNDNDSLVLRLTHQYQDTFLLGHILSEDKVTSIIQQLPLFLTKLCVSVVVGRQGYSMPEWKNYFDALNKICTQQIECDNFTGNTDIALYDSNEDDFDASVEVPKVYCTIYDCLSDSNVYQTMNEPKPETTPPEEKCNTYEVMASCSNEAMLRSTQTKPSLPPKPQKKFNRQRASSVENISKGQESSPAPPPRSHTTRQKKTKDRPSVLEFANFNEYEDICVFSREKSTEKMKTESPTFSSKPEPSGDQVPQLPPRNADQRGRRVKKKPAVTELKDSVEEMSIQDVANVLQKLKLEQYIPVFRKQWIDGAILHELNSDILHLECGMKKVEAIRLMTFVRKGHIPE